MKIQPPNASCYRHVYDPEALLMVGTASSSSWQSSCPRGNSS